MCLMLSTKASMSCSVSSPSKRSFGVDALLGPGRQRLEHGRSGGRRHAVQTAQHGEGLDDLAVVRLPVIAPQVDGNRPDEGGHRLVVHGGGDSPVWGSGRVRQEGVPHPAGGLPHTQCGSCPKNVFARHKKGGAPHKGMWRMPLFWFDVEPFWFALRTVRAALRWMRVARRT